MPRGSGVDFASNGIRLGVYFPNSQKARMIPAHMARLTALDTPSEMMAVQFQCTSLGS